MKKNTILTNITVTTLDTKGSAVIHVEGYDRPVIVSGGLLPGMKCDIRIIRKNRRKIIGRVIKIHDMGPYAKLDNVRCVHSIYPQTPIDEHRMGCGGCKRQAVSYDQQLVLKAHAVQRSMDVHHISTKSSPVLPAPEIRGYRNKIEFTYGNYIKGRGEEKHIHSERSLGFHKQGMFGKIIDVDHCDLVDETINNVYTYIKNLLRNYPTYDQVQHNGALRYLMMRQGKRTHQTMVVLSLATTGLSSESYKQLVALIHQDDYLHKHVTTFLLVEHNGLGGVIADENSVRHTLWGEGTIEEELHIEGQIFTFTLSSKSFFQTNSTGCELLYSTIAESVEEILDQQKNEKTDTLIDLYCGTGTIGIIISSLVSSISTLIGVDEAVSSIADAYANAQKNNLTTNHHFFAGRTEKVMKSTSSVLLFDDGNKKIECLPSKISLVIVDPPRSGLHAEAIDTLLQLKNAYPHIGVCYISCNPETLARDIELLSSKYVIRTIQPVDMFPHTHHIETVVSLV